MDRTDNWSIASGSQGVTQAEQVILELGPLGMWSNAGAVNQYPQGATHKHRRLTEVEGKLIFIVGRIVDGVHA